MRPRSEPVINPFQELSRALRRSTPSVDERLLASESINARANQIEKELTEDIFKYGQAREKLHLFFEKTIPKMDSGKEALSQLKDDSWRTTSRDRTLEGAFTKIAHQLSSNLQELSQVLDALRDTQEKRFLEEQKRDELVKELQDQFTFYDDVFQHTLQEHSQELRPSDIAQEARVLAEAQARRELLNQQRQHQLNQGRIVFLVTVALLSLGVLLVFVGVIGIYIFSLAAGTITTVSGILVNLISVIVLLFNKRENERLDAITRELSTLDRMTVAMLYISQISNTDKRNQAIFDLAHRLTEAHE